MQITAAVLHKAGAPMSIETLDLDDPRPTEIVVEIAGTGVCHTDLTFRDGAWPYPLPAVLGHEGGGTVPAAGPAVPGAAAAASAALPFGGLGGGRPCASGVAAV